MTQTLSRELRLKIFRRASLCRHFESYLYRCIENKKIKLPCYLSAGQEYIPATLSVLLEQFEPAIFGQHRAHSWYLAFGGDMDRLIQELLGMKTGCANGMGGSASIHCPEIRMYGHDGLMGSQVPIAVGYAYSKRTPVISVMGDASAEEDYALGALGWASTKNLPILFIIEDNNLSILTEKRVRRNWEMHDVGKSFNIDSYSTKDNPQELWQLLHNYDFNQPLLININTNRLFWHSGAGIDSSDIYDRYADELERLGDEARIMDKESEQLVEDAWKKHLEM